MKIQITIKCINKNEKYDSDEHLRNEINYGKSEQNENQNLKKIYNMKKWEIIEMKKHRIRNGVHECRTWAK